MGKSTGRVGCGLSSGSLDLLRQRIVQSKVEYASLSISAEVEAEAVTLSLRNRHPEYRRYKLKPFSLEVSQILASLCDPATTSVTSDSHDDDAAASDSDNAASPTTTSSHKCRRICRPSLSMSDQECDWSQSTFTSTSQGGDSDSDPEPDFDVTKSILRDSYLKKSTPKQLQVLDESASAKSSRKNRRHGHDNMEIDVETEKPKTMMMNNRHVGEGYSGNSGGHERKVAPRFEDLGGMTEVIEELRMEVIVPLLHPQLPRHLGVKPLSGLLLHGPPGCGKTTLAHAIANETGVPFYQISAPEVVSGVPGASEKNIRSLFDKAYRTAPSIVFIDEIDAIGSKRENLQKGMEQRIVTQLITCMDKFHRVVKDQKPDLSQDKSPGYVLVIGATNRPDAVDEALRRAGKFNKEIALRVPDEAARAEILSMLTQGVRLEGNFDLIKIAKSTPGFVGADLKSLVEKAGNLAMKRIIYKRKSSLNLQDWWTPSWDETEMESLSITMADYEDAAKMVQPSLRREGFSSIPNVTWNDVGGLSSIKNVFNNCIIQRIKIPEIYKKMKSKFEAGVLLFGPPGCGKTLIAQAVANEAGANFIHIKGPELLNKYVGESESLVRKLFARARTNSPCIIFFDEIDALTTKRGTEGGLVVDRVVNQLLIELNGVDDGQGVFVIGATNRIEVMDEALLRAGRLGKKLYVPLPSADERVAIMKAHARERPIDADVDLDALARMERCNNLSGADLASLVEEASTFAIQEYLANKTSISYDELIIKTSHFEQALSEITPSVTDKQREYYEALSNNHQARK
ncbi:cell division control protein 48 homolog C-like [Carex rostrata]